MRTFNLGARRGLPGALVLTLVMTAPVSEVKAQPALDLQDCRPEGVSVPARCGSLTVFEDRAAGAGRTIDLNIVVIPAVSDSPEPDPLFFLAGGPGQAATDLAQVVLSRFANVRRGRDIVFVDQRGTGGSGGMTCAFFETELDEPEISESLQVDTLGLDDLRDCLAEIAAVADPRQYTTPIAMDDLDDVRAALGYETINLYGGSYGTRAGLIYMRRHPERVRSAVLDGLAPVSMRLPSNMNDDGHRALDRLFADCEADAGCREAFPDLPETFARVIEDLEANPRLLTTTHPRTGEPFEMALSAPRFASGLRGVLYSPLIASLLPWTITRAAEADFGPFLAQVIPLADASGQINPGMFLSVICAEDLSQLADDDVEALAANGILGRLQIETFASACTVWPAGELPADYFEPVRSDAPTLLLSGDLDPVTPPRWGDEVLAGLSNARHVVAPGAGHGVIARGCADDVVADFIEAGTHAGLDVSCLERIRRPPFMLSAAGTDP
ncbi:MAG: alpha/beta fold hydrolase [Acidobacteria bacterium]|nr:alpha/beta fold hydrolase [Acidobacteriota bacterium]MYJ05072.1 alpha/beta fold hydrolase [Acidobacteriota bacterium]